MMLMAIVLLATAVLVLGSLVLDLRRRISHLENQTFDDPQLTAWDAQSPESEGQRS